MSGRSNDTSAVFAGCLWFPLSVLRVNTTRDDKTSTDTRVDWTDSDLKHFNHIQLLRFNTEEKGLETHQPALDASSFLQIYCKESEQGGWVASVRASGLVGNYRRPTRVADVWVSLAASMWTLLKILEKESHHDKQTTKLYLWKPLSPHALLIFFCRSFWLCLPQQIEFAELPRGWYLQPDFSHADLFLIHTLGPFTVSSSPGPHVDLVDQNETLYNCAAIRRSEKMSFLSQQHSSISHTRHVVFHLDRKRSQISISPPLLPFSRLVSPHRVRRWNYVDAQVELHTTNTVLFSIKPTVGWDDY